MGPRRFQCRRCGSGEGYRSRSRNLFEKYVLPVFLLRPVRCGQCYRRSYRWVFQRVRQVKGPGITNGAAV
jgi:hypothetical protein